MRCQRDLQVQMGSSGSWVLGSQYTQEWFTEPEICCAQCASLVSHQLCRDNRHHQDPTGGGKGGGGGDLDPLAQKETGIAVDDRLGGLVETTTNLRWVQLAGGKRGERGAALHLDVGAMCRAVRAIPVRVTQGLLRIGSGARGHATTCMRLSLHVAGDITSGQPWYSDSGRQ